jgi:hypothetical protein
MLGFDHFIDQPSGSGETHAALLPAGGDGQAGQQMGFAGARVADKNDRLGVRDVIASVQFVDLLGRNLWNYARTRTPPVISCAANELREGAFRSAAAAFFEFGLQQRFEIAEIRCAV